MVRETGYSVLDWMDVEFTWSWMPFNQMIPWYFLLVNTLNGNSGQKLVLVRTCPPLAKVHSESKTRLAHPLVLAGSCRMFKGPGCGSERPFPVGRASEGDALVLVEVTRIVRRGGEVSVRPLSAGCRRERGDPGKLTHAAAA